MVIKKIKTGLRIIREGPQKKAGYYFTMNTTDLTVEKLAITPGLTMDKITQENVYKIIAFRNESAVNQILSYINMGCKGVMACINDKAVGHALCMLPKAEYNEFKIRNSAYIFFCYVDECYRGMGIYPHMLASIIEFVASENRISKFSISTATDNISSQKGLQKVGFSQKTAYQTRLWWKIYLNRIIL